MSLQFSRLAAVAAAALLLLLTIGILDSVSADTLSVVHDDVPDSELGSFEEKAEPIASIHISTPKLKESATTSSAKKPAALNASHMPDEATLAKLFEASKHDPMLAAELKMKKILPDNAKDLKSTVEIKRINSVFDDNRSENYDSDEDDSDDGVDDDDVDDVDTIDDGFDDYEFHGGAGLTKTKEAKNSKAPLKTLKVIEALKSEATKNEGTKSSKKLDGNWNAENENENEEYDEGYDGMGDIYPDDIAENEVVFSQSKPCPRYCKCERNYIGYKVATCSRLDAGVQEFGTDITDITVANVSPKYPIVLTSRFFARIGLKHVANINFDNCTIQDMHQEAFHELDELYSVNLTDVGLQVFNPDIFATNKKLRMLTISGNDLNSMSELPYFINSTSLEELDLSRSNLLRLSPHAFSRVTNIVSLNLAQNKLEKIPAGTFDFSRNIEELDLSFNSLRTLPARLFKYTPLSVLHLKYNAFSDNLSFGISDIQTLDLSYNSILNVHRGMFDKMLQLRTLNLRGNGISKIQPESFATLNALRNLDLSVNELDQISSLLFLNNGNLSVLRLNDNPNLTELPTDGFRTTAGYFPIFLLDLSNCALSALGFNTFATMPDLVTLKLAWNNLNNLERGTFESLKKLTDLDLSNNLIKTLNTDIFRRNTELVRLNLGGNPLSALTPKLFAPFKKLRELDVSECDLTELFTAQRYNSAVYKFYSTLQVINASHNELTTISKAQVRVFKNLRTLDIQHNPLQCDNAFRDFVTYISLDTKIGLSPRPMLARLGAAEMLPTEVEAHVEWSKFAKEICKHTPEADGLIDKELDNRIKKVDKEVAQDTRTLFEIIQKARMDKIMKDSKRSNNNATVEPLKEQPAKAEAAPDMVKHVQEFQLHQNAVDYSGDVEGDDYDEFNHGDAVDDADNDDDEDDDDDDDDEYGSDEDEAEAEEVADDVDVLEEAGKAKALEELFKKHAEVVTVSININKEQAPVDGSKIRYIHDDKSDTADSEERAQDVAERKTNRNEHVDNDDVDDVADDDDDFEEIILQHGRIYYRDYKSSLAAIGLLLFLLAVLLLVVRMIVVIMRRRGERYRMALLAHSNNSFVYQKLSEDIAKPKKSNEQHNVPKVHGYAPLQMV